MPSERHPKESADHPKPPVDPPQQPFADRRRNFMTFFVVGGLMIVEGVGIVLAIKFTGGQPQSAAADDEHADQFDEHGVPLLQESEVEVTDLMAFNNKGGPIYIYQIGVYAQVPTSSKKVFEAFVANRRQTVEDRLSRIVRAADPKFFDEPGLETLRRQFKYELNKIIGDESIVQEILFPEFNKTRAD